MAITPPLKDDDLSAEARDTLDEVRAAFGEDSLTAYRMFAHSHAVLEDGFANMRRYIRGDQRPDGTANSLDLAQREAIALAASSANNCKSCVKSHAEHCKQAGWSDREVAEVLGLTAVCSMLNHHHRLRHIAPQLKLPEQSGLSFETLTAVTLPKPLVELICIVVSGINHCPLCVRHHTQQARDLGVSDEQVHDAVYIASTMTMFNVYFRTQ